jgi:hypothetical protein
VPHPQSLDESVPSRAADELLVVRCQLGEPDAFDALIDRWHGPLWQYIRRMTGRDEEAQGRKRPGCVRFAGSHGGGTPRGITAGCSGSRIVP